MVKYDLHSTLTSRKKSRSSHLKSKRRVVLPRGVLGLSTGIKNVFSRKRSLDKAKTNAQIDRAIKELETEARKIRELDQKIIRLQQSTRTSFAVASRFHIYLCMRSKLYHSVHNLPYAHHLNTSALVIFLISFSFAVVSNFTSWMGPSVSRHLAVNFIKASNEDDSTIYTRDNKNLIIGFSNRGVKK